MEASDVVVASLAVFGRGDILAGGVDDSGSLTGHKVASADQVREDGAQKGLVLGRLDLGHVCGLRRVEELIAMLSNRWTDAVCVWAWLVLCLWLAVCVVVNEWKRRCFEICDGNGWLIRW